MIKADDHGEFPEEVETEDTAVATETVVEDEEEENGERIPTEGAILLTVRGMALFPGVVLPIIVGRERSIRAVQAAVQREVPVGVILQRDPDESDPGPEGLYRVGTVAEIATETVETVAVATVIGNVVTTIRPRTLATPTSQDVALCRLRTHSSKQTDVSSALVSV